LVDLHSHILPGLDDGARTIDETIALAKQSVQEGVTHMVCTPHVHPSVFDNTESTIQEAFEAAVDAIHQHNIPLKMAYAAEVRLSIEIIEWIQAKSIPFLGSLDNKKVLLLELPHSHIPAGTDNLVNWLTNQGIQPVIPHPERNREIMANYEKVRWLKNLGCLFQMTAGAVTGRFRKESEDIAWRMLEDDLVTYVASDLHNLHKRPNDMGTAYKKVKEVIGQTKAQMLFQNVPAHITQSKAWY